MKAWLGSGEAGALLELSDARVSVLDRGFTVGEGLFETMKLVQGRVFLWPWHLERLQQAAQLLRLPIPEGNLLTDVVQQVAVANGAAIGSLGRLRLTVTAGPDQGAATVSCVALVEKPPFGAAALTLVGWPRNERSPLVAVKSTSYAENLLALQAARAGGAAEAVFFNTRDELAEGATSNLFIVEDGVVVTPPTSAGLLPGVTRRFVLGLAAADLSMVEEPISRARLAAADEVFLTSSLQDVRAVAGVDERSYAPGPMTALVQDRFGEAATASWCWS